MEVKYVPPEFQKEAFHCPYCQVYAQQYWYQLCYRLSEQGTPVWQCKCRHCNGFSVWLVVGSLKETEGIMIHPIDTLQGPPPHKDMPEEIKADYLEALSIVNKSPRGAAALLRLALQKLMKELGESGDNLYNDITSLVQKGLPKEIQQALDAIRVIGNHAVHPGVLDLRDDRDTAMGLFELMNQIVEETIATKKRRAALIERLPEPIRKKIQRT